MIVNEIRDELFRIKDDKYRDFQSKLIPTADPDSFIGVRTPALRQYAKTLKAREDIGAFLEDLPHTYFDENQLHAFIVSEIRNYDDCLEAVETFLPYVDNWATCDQMSPKIFRKHKEELLDAIPAWIGSGRTYTVRFGIKMLMDHFLNEDFDRRFADMVAGVRSEEYYVRMMVAWYFATALAKQYDAILPYIREQRLDIWTHNKAIQKALESNRVSREQKDYLRGLKRKAAPGGGK